MRWKTEASESIYIHKKQSKLLYKFFGYVWKTIQFEHVVCIILNQQILKIDADIHNYFMK